MDGWFINIFVFTYFFGFPHKKKKKKKMKYKKFKNYYKKTKKIYISGKSILKRPENSQRLVEKDKKKKKIKIYHIFSNDEDPIGKENSI
jgi:hypothetical protein